MGHATSSQFYSITTPSGKVYSPLKEDAGHCLNLRLMRLLRTIAFGSGLMGTHILARKSLSRDQTVVTNGHGGQTQKRGTISML